MKRLLTLLALMLALDGIGLFTPEPICQLDRVFSYGCRQAVDLALAALPAGHASVASVTLERIDCIGYCPLVLGQSVAIALSDHTRYTIWLDAAGGRLAANLGPADSW